MKIKTFTSYDDVEMVEIDNEDGSFTSMTKSTYDTLASELSNPSTPQAGE